MAFTKIWEDFKACKEPYFRLELPKPSMELTAAAPPRIRKIHEEAPNLTIVEIKTDLLDDGRFACLKAMRDLDEQSAFGLLLTWWSMFALGIGMKQVIPIDRLSGKGLAEDLHQCGFANVVKRKKSGAGLYTYHSVLSKVGKHTKIIGVDIEAADCPCKFSRSA